MKYVPAENIDCAGWWGSYAHNPTRTEVFHPFSPVLIPMDDYGYWDFFHDTCFIMDDFGTAVRTPWVDWPESYYKGELKRVSRVSINQQNPNLMR